MRSAGGRFANNRVLGNRKGAFLLDDYSEVLYDAVAQLNHLGGAAQSGEIHVVAA